MLRGEDRTDDSDDLLDLLEMDMGVSGGGRRRLQLLLLMAAVVDDWLIDWMPFYLSNR